MHSLSCGIVGLPNVGKSELFNALTNAGVDSANYPFCTIDANVGIVIVPDSRIEVLSKISKTDKLVYSTIKFVDIAGLVKGAASGEGLGNKFLSHIRETDAIIHVVRCFVDENIVHVNGKIDPIGDIDIINIELVLADLQTAKTSLEKLGKQAKLRKELVPSVNVLEKIISYLEEGISLRNVPLTDEEKAAIKSYAFLSIKPILYLANVSEEDVLGKNEYVQLVQELAIKEGSECVVICAKLEKELSELSDEDKVDYLNSVGLEEPGLNKLAKQSFSLLGLISYLTTGKQETRSWTIRKGSTAAEAGGAIHSDIQKGFIRAEVITYDDFVLYQGRTEAAKAGKMRSEGKEYIVQDGDVVLFLHN